jgi:hypothetical protein
MVVRHDYHVTDTELLVAYSVYATATKHTYDVQTCVVAYRLYATARVSTGPIDCRTGPSGGAAYLRPRAICMRLINL